ncbi:prolipoprotein diacylglyceryl transferase [Natranaerobius trueperi]|uniref:Phosphatidylglycerol--prolipoprotein diacylglyceryl transferase n=1 Tax=Natranaerobius trueperi TaxID=759412 RepID=A0A226BXC8_9FIRM|nr:prolipoprotein diacylglyceryl transferase [Natranaerobius trueperi]OWZ83605.1 prolipoprotein diacylglyceryl transferase [Natranaerobius trueperi]
MDPVAFSIGPISVYWYGIFISLGILIGLYLAVRESKKQGLDPDHLINFLLFALPAALIGLRLYYVAFRWDYFSQNLDLIFAFRQGGLAIHGGIFAAIIVGVIYSKYQGINFWALADITAPSLILGQAIGRWGNYINQEAYGYPTDLPWAIEINGSFHHPTFFYESFWNLLVFAFLMYFRGYKKEGQGEIFSLYLVLYSIGRFWIEGLRLDSLMLSELRVAQIVSVILVVIGLYYFTKHRKEKNKTVDIKR